MIEHGFNLAESTVRERTDLLPRVNKRQGMYEKEGEERQQEAEAL